MVWLELKKEVFGTSTREHTVAASVTKVAVGAGTFAATAVERSGVV